MNLKTSSRAEYQAKKALLRFAVLKGWSSAAAGITLVSTTPSFISFAKAAHAPLTWEIATLLLLIGSSSILLAGRAFREIAALRRDLQGYQDFVEAWSALANLSASLPSRPATTGNPLRAA